MEKKYTTIILKTELKKEMDRIIDEIKVETGLDLSYSSLIKYLIKTYDKENRKN